MEHPITPPPELVEEWIAQVWHEGTPVRVGASDIHIATQAARWGADQELEACCEQLAQLVRGDRMAEYLRITRRPKPLSLKQQALDVLKHARDGWGPVPTDWDIIRRALETVDD